MEDPTDIFARDARHCGEVILGDFLLNNDASLSNVTTKLFAKTQQNARNASLDGKKARGCHDIVGEAQTTRQQSREIAVELRPRLSKRFEDGAANETQRGIS
jgi:hypothetical protein